MKLHNEHPKLNAAKVQTDGTGLTSLPTKTGRALKRKMAMSIKFIIVTSCPGVRATKL